MLNAKLVKRLEKFFEENDMYGEKATVQQIADAESELGVKFPEDYAEFITRFGGTFAGIGIYAFEDPQNIIQLTKQLREDYGEDDARHEEAMQSIVIADDGAGNPFLLNQQGDVVIFYHDCNEREVLAPSLGAFIEENFEEW